MWDDDVAGIGASVSPFNENIYIHCLSHSALYRQSQGNVSLSATCAEHRSNILILIFVPFKITNYSQTQRVLKRLLYGRVNKRRRRRKRQDWRVFIAQMQTIQQLTFKATWLQWLLPPYMETLHTFCFPGCGGKVSVCGKGKLCQGLNTVSNGLYSTLRPLVALTPNLGQCHTSVVPKGRYCYLDLF